MKTKVERRPDAFPFIKTEEWRNGLTSCRAHDSSCASARHDWAVFYELMPAALFRWKMHVVPEGQVHRLTEHKRSPLCTLAPGTADPSKGVRGSSLLYTVSGGEGAVRFRAA